MSTLDKMIEYGKALGLLEASDIIATVSAKYMDSEAVQRFIFDTQELIVEAARKKTITVEEKDGTTVHDTEGQQDISG